MDNIIVNSNLGGQQIERSNPNDVEEALRLIEDLKFFLATSPANWQENQVIRRYYLNNDEGFVSCVFWNNLYYITGTDIVRCCVYRMQKFGREVVERKKFEEGIFSDLRNLKCGVDATLEMPKSEFLSFLHKNLCLKTQKKQKVFFWFSVPHDKLFADALERDLRRESAGQPSATRAIAEPALTFRYDEESGSSLYDQVVQHLDTKRISVYSDTFSSVTSLQSGIVDDADSHDEDDIHSENDEDPSDNKHNDNTRDDDSGAFIRSEDGCSNQSGKITNMIMNEHQNISEIKTEMHELDDEMLSTQNDISSVVIRTDISTAPTTTYSPEELVIDDVKSNNNTYSLDDNIDLLTKEDDDFPLDYFPLEIEYPCQEQGRGVNPLFHDSEMDMFSSMPPTAGLYDNPYAHPDILSKYMYAPTIPIPSEAVPSSPSPPSSIPASRAHFMTNGEYYAAVKNKHGVKQPCDMYKDIDAVEQNGTDAVEQNGTDTVLNTSEEQTSMNNSKNINMGRNSAMNGNIGIPFQDFFAGYQGMVPPGMYQHAMPGYAYGIPCAGSDDLMYEHWMYMQLLQSQQNDSYMNSQIPFPGRFVPSFYLSTPTNPYMAISPYQPKHPGSSTAKNFSIYSSYYGRRNMPPYLSGFPSIQATQPSSATRMHSMKQNNISTQTQNNAAYGAHGIPYLNKSSNNNMKKKVSKVRTQHQSLKTSAKARRIDSNADLNLEFANVMESSGSIDTDTNTENQSLSQNDLALSVDFQNIDAEI